MIEKVAASTTIRLVPELVPLDDLFSKEAAITLYRVVQESLNNIVKHSQASEARISIERQSDAVSPSPTTAGALHPQAPRRKGQLRPGRDDRARAHPGRRTELSFTRRPG
jgi:glucose-6-phosphate-specific signal transduction histidine kinase